MKTPARFLAALLFLAALPLAAQQQTTVEFNPVSCWRADEMAVLRVGTTTDGTLRAFYRRAESTDWCWVDGNNAGQNSSITMPKFEQDAEIEYYFTTIVRSQITARSSHIYRAKVTSRCDTLFTRKVPYLVFGCSSASSGSPSAVGAAYSAKSISAPPSCPESSPDTPCTASH